MKYDTTIDVRVDSNLKDPDGYSKISDLSQLIKRFEYGRPDPETVKPFSYEIKPPFQQSQHVTLKGELKWELNPNHHLNFTLSFQENLRQEFENRKKTQWSWIPMQDLMLKTYKFDVLWQAKWKLWKMTTDAGLSVFELLTEILLEG